VTLPSHTPALHHSKFLIALAPSLAQNAPMLAKVCSAAVNGIEAYPVEVEVNAGHGDTIIVVAVNKSPKPVLDWFL
jgi:hypothetical protein